MKRRSFALTAVAALTALTASPVAAQRTGAPRAGWLPTNNRINELALLTAAEKAAVSLKLGEIQRILLGVPELARPSGFEVRATLQPGRSSRADRKHIIAYGYTLSFYVPTHQGARAVCSCVEVIVNFGPDVVNAYSPPLLHDERGDIFFEPPRGELIPAATHVYERLSQAERSHVIVVLTAGQESPWTAVTREQFLKASILSAEGKSSKDVIAYRKTLAKTPYQLWLAEGPQRKRAREANIASVERLLSPPEIAQMRKRLEATERAVGEKLKASENEDRAAAAKVLAAPLPGDRFRRQLAALSPTHRAKPAWVDELDLNKLVEPEAPRSRRVVRPNLDFYRARRSPIEVRGILVRFSSIPGDDTNAVSHALWQTYKKLNWQALARLLEQPTE